MNNYPDDMRQHDNNPGSPLFDDSNDEAELNAELDRIYGDEDLMALAISQIPGDAYMEMLKAIDKSMSGLAYFMTKALCDENCGEYQLVLARAFKRDYLRHISKDEPKIGSDILTPEVYNIIDGGIYNAAENNLQR